MAEASPDAVLFARTRTGLDLPIIDVTHPRFKVADDEDARRNRFEAYVRDDRRRRFIPKFLLRLMLRRMVRKSGLAAALFNSNATYLDGISTYVMKLGAENLVAPFDTPAARSFAASPHITLARLRMQQVASLLAEGIGQDEAFVGNHPLHLINIAGGPALDSINCLILLKCARPELVHRPIIIHVLDRETDGAFFGANALDVLKGRGNPLDGVEVSLHHHDYDWNHPEDLTRYLAKIKAEGAAIAASSEGGLFEYGSDEAIIGNLGALKGNAQFVVGSVTGSDPIRRRMIALSKFKVIPRGLEGMKPLADAAGFEIAKTLPALLSEQILLRLKAQKAL